MESNTNRQIAERLTALVGQLVQNGDTIADSAVNEAVAALEQAASLTKQEFECSSSMKVAAPNLNLDASRDLSTVIEEIRTTSSSGQPLSERFRDEVAQHDRTRCIASIVFEDLWNGFDGWKPPSDFWKMVVFVWRNAPDFFEDYDPEREIKEEPSRWTQRYFDEQRNFLRHNFCLRRLCHLVMVYEYLHGTEATVKKPSLVQPTCSGGSDNMEMPRLTTPNRGFLSRSAVIACVALTAAGLIYLLGSRNGEERSKSVTAQSAAFQIASEQPSPNQPGQTISEKATNFLAGTSVRDEAQKQDTRSNEVVKSTIALQEAVPQPQKDSIRRAGSIANKQ